MNYLAKIIGYLSARYHQLNKISLQQVCFLCGASAKLAVCQTCAQELHIPNKKRCLSCSVYIEPINSTLDYCGVCLTNSYAFNQSFAIYDYEDMVRVLITNFKYQKNLAVGKFLALQLSNKLKTMDNYDVIIPMPIHKKRLKSRGFHHINELLQIIKQQNHIDVNSCTRIKPTQELYKLNPMQRQKEINGAFKVVKKMTYKKILIVDDIMTTTTSTAELATTIIKSYKAYKLEVPKIDILVLARALK